MRRDLQDVFTYDKYNLNILKRHILLNFCHKPIILLLFLYYIECRAYDNLQQYSAHVCIAISRRFMFTPVIPYLHVSLDLSGDHEVILAKSQFS